MKILIALPRFPYPLEKGDKLRAYHQIRTLSRKNEIFLFCVSHTPVSPDQIEALKPYCKEIKIVRPARIVSIFNACRNYVRTKSLQIGYWDSKVARKECKRMVERAKPDVIYSQMVRTMPWVARLGIPKVMDFQDALSKNVERRMEISSGIMHAILHYEFKMLRSSEYNSFKIFNDLTIISEPDSEAIPHQKNEEIHIIPNGVDFDCFKCRECDKRYDIVFCGNMQYEPNINASTFLVNEIMPLVWKEIPDAKVLIAGANPKQAVKKLSSKNVTVSGWVDDISECYAQSHIFVAPMQIGSGLQNKLLEAMAMNIPCITTPLANSALKATENKEILIGEAAADFANHIVALLRSEEKRKVLSEQAFTFVKEHYSWEKFGDQLEAILQNASKQPIKEKIKKKRY